MNRKTVSIILIAFGFSILYSYYSRAGRATTLVEGYITEDTIWSLENSPYIIVNDTIVETGVKLTITPGVVVKFASGTNIIVDGTLIGSGNETHRVEFTSNNTTPKSGDWGSIRFRSTSVSSILNWTIVEYGADVIYVDGSNVSILNSEIRYNQYAAHGGYGSVLEVRNCSFINNTYGIYSEPYNVLEVETCSFMNNTYGILAEAQEDTKIYASTFFDNEVAISVGHYRLEVYSSIFSKNMWAIRGRLSNLYIVGCNITDNNHGLVSPNIELSYSIISGNRGTGIACNVSLQVTNCTISDNLQNGIICEFYSPYFQAEIHFCNIYNNTPYDIVNKERFEFDINATLNWWGTENETYIEEKIYDYYDDYMYSKVIFKPYLNEPAIVIEKFSSLLTMTLFMTATLLAALVYKNHRNRTSFHRVL